MSQAIQAQTTETKSIITIDKVVSVPSIESKVELDKVKTTRLITLIITNKRHKIETDHAP